MASTFTTRIGLEKQGDGENPNTWGLRLNQNTIDLVDEAVAGYETVNVSAATTTTLTVNSGSSDQARNMGLKFQGNLTEDKYVLVPTKEKVYYIRNDTTGDFNIYLKQDGAADGTKITVVESGFSMMAAVDPVDVVIDVMKPATSVATATNAIFFANTSTAQYVRTDQASRVSVGGIQFDDNVSVTFGTDGDADLYHNNSDLYLDLSNGDSLIVRNGATTRFTLNTNSGDFTATGNITAYSDERLKSNIKTLDGSKAFDMRGVSYTKDGEESSGVIAQELEAIAPELVIEGEEYKSVAYGNIVGYLIEAVKLLKEEVEELKAKVQ